MVITGNSQTFGHENAMRRFCYDNNLDVEFLADWARPITDRIRQLGEDLSEMSGMPMIDCNRFKDRKDELVKKRLSEIDARHGDIIAVFKSMENCRSFYRSQSALSAKTKGCPFRLRSNKCNHYYFYMMDRELGLVCLRIQSYAPFQIQFIINGHHVLEQMMKKHGMDFDKLDNCFTRIECHEKAQELADSITGPFIDKQLDRISRSIIPLKDIMPEWYRFTVRQIELSRDVYTPSDDVSKDKVRNTILQLCLQRPDDFISYITQPPRSPRKPEFSYRNTRLGVCAKFHTGTTSIKAYHKFDSVLRIETSCYNLRKISARRAMVKRDGTIEIKTAPLTRSLKDIGLFLKFARNANQRMAERLDVFWGQSYSNKELRSTSGRTEGQKINFSGINFFAKKDADLLKSAGSPQYDLSGFKRSDIARQTGLNPGQAGYAIRRLRAHHLIKKINGTNRYFLTKKGRRATTGTQLLEHIVMAPLMSA
jgi:hypothetical protein